MRKIMGHGRLEGQSGGCLFVPNPRGKCDPPLFVVERGGKILRYSSTKLRLIWLAQHTHTNGLFAPRGSCRLLVSAGRLAGDDWRLYLGGTKRSCAVVADPRSQSSVHSLCGRTFVITAEQR